MSHWTFLELIFTCCTEFCWKICWSWGMMSDGDIGWLLNSLMVWGWTVGCMIQKQYQEKVLIKWVKMKLCVGKKLTILGSGIQLPTLADFLRGDDWKLSVWFIRWGEEIIKSTITEKKRLEQLTCGDRRGTILNGTSLARSKFPDVTENLPFWTRLPFDFSSRESRNPIQRFWQNTHFNSTASEAKKKCMKIATHLLSIW